MRKYNRNVFAYILLCKPAPLGCVLRTIQGSAGESHGEGLMEQMRGVSKTLEN